MPMAMASTITTAVVAVELAVADLPHAGRDAHVVAYEFGDVRRLLVDSCFSTSNTTDSGFSSSTKSSAASANRRGAAAAAMAMTVTVTFVSVVVLGPVDGEQNLRCVVVVEHLAGDHAHSLAGALEDKQREGKQRQGKTMGTADTDRRTV